MSIFKLFYLSIKKNKNHKEWSAECLRKKTKKQKTNQNKTGYLSEMTKGKETETTKHHNTGIYQPVEYAHGRKAYEQGMKASAALGEHWITL